MERNVHDLIDKIAKKEGVTADHIMMGPGSSDLLEKVALVTFMKGEYRFGDPLLCRFVSVAKSVGATWKPVPYTADWSHDLKAMEAAIDKDTKLVYVLTANNPTGAITKGQDLLDFCSRVSGKVPVFVDEAYIELAVEPTRRAWDVTSGTKEKRDHRPYILRKSWGMAGIRVGYIAAQPEFLESINKITRGDGYLLHVDLCGICQP